MSVDTSNANQRLENSVRTAGFNDVHFHLPFYSEGLIVTLIAYVDESGTHDQSGITVLAGFIGTKRQWTAFEMAWRKLLLEAGLDEFHAVEVERAWSDRPELRLYVKDQFTSAVLESGVFPLSTQITRSAWEYFRSVEPAADTDWRSPYAFCFQHTVRGATLWSEQYAGSQPVAFVFDNATQYKRDVTDLMAGLRRHKVYGIELAASETFASSRLFPGLQAADLFAYDMYSLHGKRPGPEDRRFVLALIERAQRVFCRDYITPRDVWELVADRNTRVGVPVPPRP